MNADLLRRLLATCVLALYALLGAGGVHGLVLCIEEDGRLAVEGSLGCADACAEESGTHGSEDGGPDLHECPCTDIPLAAAGLHVRPLHDGPDVPPAPLALLAPLAAAPDLAPPAPREHVAHAPPPRESRLRITTVVLRA